MSGKRIKKIAVVVQRPLDQRDYQRFGIQTFLDQGIDVTVIDAADVIHPGVHFDRTAFNDTNPSVRIVIVRTSKDVRQTVPDLNEADLILNLAQSGLVTDTNFSVMRAISKSTTPYLVNLGNTYPGHDSSNARRTIVDRLGNRLARLREIKPWRSIVARIPPVLLGIRPADFAVRGGLNIVNSRFISDATKMIDAHSLDYDNYLDADTDMIKQTDTAVFIDEFRPYHSDTSLKGYDNFIDADLYFDRLRRFFDRLEKELGLRVVIAACPRAEYDNMQDVFGGRDVIWAQTPALVAASKLVLGHRSTALAYAVMFGRPALQIATDNNYGHPSMKSYFDAYAEALGKKIQFYDNPDTAVFVDALRIDSNRYKAFIDNFVKMPDSPEQPFWHIVLNAIEEAYI